MMHTCMSMYASMAFVQIVNPAHPDHTPQVWEHAVMTGTEAIVDGLSRIRRCTFEGRVSMTYDLSHVDRGVSVTPPCRECMCSRVSGFR